MLFLISPIISISQWVQISSGGITQPLDGIHFLDTQNGFCSGGLTNILTTDDAGASWTTTSLTGIRDYDFLDNTFGYGASISGYSMKRTTNGGSSYAGLTPINSSSLWAVSATSSTVAYYVGVSGILWKVTGGSTVTAMNSGETTVLTDIVFTNTTTGFIVVQQGRIKKTVNSGVTWTDVYTGTTTLSEMHFVDANIGYAVGNALVIKTIDGGQNWTALTTGDLHLYYGVHFFDANHGIVVGTNGTIIYTSDGGNTWLVQSSGTTEHLKDVRMLSATSAVVIGDNGTILKNSTISTVGVNDVDNLLELSIYPNPVVDLITIRSNSLMNSVVLFDLKGDVLYQETNFNSQNKTIDFSSLPAGVYLLSVNSTNGKSLQKIVKY